MSQFPNTKLQQNPAVQQSDIKTQLGNAIDGYPETALAGIVIFDPNRTPRVIRMPFDNRRPWVVIVPRGNANTTEQTAISNIRGDSPTFWGRWGDAILSCGGAVASGTAIYFSAGTATPLVGAFALNSAALCGLSVGKGIAHDDWEQFKAEGGAVYTAWITFETGMNLIGLFDGAKGGLQWMKRVRDAGKLDELRAAISLRNLTRRQLAEVIQKFDDSVRFDADVTRASAAWMTRSEYRMAGTVVLENFRKKAIVDCLSAVFTTRDFSIKLEEAYDVLLMTPKDADR